MLLGGLITCVFVSCILFLFGYLIGKKKNLSFIAGYDEQTFKGDKHKLANAVGSFLGAIGVLTLILPFSLEFISPDSGVVFTIVIILGTISLIVYIKSISKG